MNTDPLDCIVKWTQNALRVNGSRTFSRNCLITLAKLPACLLNPGSSRNHSIPSEEATSARLATALKEADQPATPSKYANGMADTS